MRVDRHVTVRTAPKSCDSKVSGGWVDRATRGFGCGRLQISNGTLLACRYANLVSSQIRYKDVPGLINALTRR